MPETASERSRCPASGRRVGVIPDVAVQVADGVGRRRRRRDQARSFVEAEVRRRTLRPDVAVEVERRLPFPSEIEEAREPLVDGGRHRDDCPQVKVRRPREDLGDEVGRGAVAEGAAGDTGRRARGVVGVAGRGEVAAVAAVQDAGRRGDVVDALKSGTGRIAGAVPEEHVV